jgi:hypothetical protein
VKPDLIAIKFLDNFFSSCFTTLQINQLVFKTTNHEHGKKITTICGPPFEGDHKTLSR